MVSAATMHRRLGRSKERFAVLAMSRKFMTRILGALLAFALSVLVLVCMGFAGAYQAGEGSAVRRRVV